MGTVPTFVFRVKGLLVSEPKSNKIMNPVAFVCVIIAALIASYAVGFMPKAHAATGAPGIGHFTAGSVLCESSSWQSSQLDFSGALETKSPTVLGITAASTTSTDRDGATMVWINNVALSPITDPEFLATVAPGVYYELPAWNGVPGQQPKLGVAVNGVKESSRVMFSLAWRSGVAYGLLAVAYPFQGCDLTQNPAPPFEYNYILPE